MALPNYVKFQRGTLASYNRLSRKDADTLYFIYDSENENRGTLYLGDRLIGGVGSEGGVGNLSELSDVLINAAQTGDFLVLNSEGKWTSTSASNVAQAILETGGNIVSIDEAEFQFNSVNGKLELKGYAEAATGLMPVKSASGIVWQSPAPDLSSRVGNLETGLSSAQTNINTLQTQMAGVDNQIAVAINKANHLRYKVISNLSEATKDNTVYLYSNGSEDAQNRYSEYMLIDGQLELIGMVGVDLSDYMTTKDIETALNAKADAADLAALQTRVGSLETNVSNLSTTVSNLNTTVSNLQTNVTNLSNQIDNFEDNYVLTTTFNNVVGDLSLVNGIKNNLNSDATISDNLIEIYDRLTWQEISE